MPKAKNEDGRSRDLITQLIIADDDPPDLARLVGFQLLANPWMLEQSIGCMGELLDDTRRRIGRNRAQMLVEAH